MYANAHYWNAYKVRSVTPKSCLRVSFESQLHCTPTAQTPSIERHYPSVSHGKIEFVLRNDHQQSPCSAFRA